MLEKEFVININKKKFMVYAFLYANISKTITRSRIL